MEPIGTLEEGEFWVPNVWEYPSDKNLSAFEPNRVLLMGARFRNHSHPGGEELFVLSGSLSDEHGDYPEGTWLRNPPGSEHSPYSEEGCLVFLKSGHL